MAVLDVIAHEGLVANANIVGAYLRDGLRALASRRELIGDVRGAGFFVGVELVDDAQHVVPHRQRLRALSTVCARDAC